MALFFAEVASIPPTAPEPTVTAPPAMSFRFMDLPVELRIIVYGYLVVVGKVFLHSEQDSLYNACLVEDYREYPAPDLTILRVSKAIHSEAEALYLSMNTFVLPSKWHVHPPIDYTRAECTGSTGRILFSKSAFEKVKHIRIALDSGQGYAPLTVNSAGWDQHGSFETPFDQMTGEARLSQAHTYGLAWLYDHRFEMSDAIAEFEGLQSIEIDFTNAYCPVGCCRDFRLAWNKVLRHCTRIEAVGLRDGEERYEIEDCFWETMESDSGLTTEEYEEISLRYHWTYEVRKASNDDD